MEKAKVLLIMLLVIALAFAGCAKEEVVEETAKVEANETEAVAEPEEVVEITFWHNYGADAESPYFEEVILPMFEEQYPNIHVTVIAQGNDQYTDQIVVSAGTDTAPDVARLDITSVAGLAKLGALYPLDGLEGFEDVKASLFEGPMSANLYQGSYYAMPLDTNCKTAVFNMATLEKIGLAEVPATMEEFIEASKGAGFPTINVSSAGEWDFMPYFWLFGGAVTNDEFTKATGYLDSQASIDAVNKLVDLHDEGILTIKEIDGSTDAWDGIKSGEYAAFFEGPWFFTFTGDWQELGLQPALIPSYNGTTTSVLGGESIGVFANCEHPEEAFKFVKFLLSEEVQVMMGKDMGQMPVNAAAAANEELTSDAVWSVYLEQLNSVQTRVPSPESTTIQQYLKDAFDGILRGEMTTEDALTEAAELIDAVLAQ